jgi:predicted Zn-dependent protease
MASVRLSTRFLPAAALVALVAAVVVSCATNPVSGRRQFTLMGEGEEVALGRQMDQQVRQQMGLYDDAEWQGYVSRVGLELARTSHRPDLPWSFAVVDTPTVNAFALPGGFIYITRGLLAYLGSEAELAGVLGHEIGHVTARHAAEQYTRSTSAQLGLALGTILFPEAAPYGDLAGTGLGLLFLKYGRSAELEADRLGAEYAARSGWDPAGIAGMLSTLGRLDVVSRDRRGVPNWLATHPDPGSRVSEIAPVVASLQPMDGAAVRVERESYLRRLDGLLFGDDPREGIVRGNTLLHPVLRIAVQFPAGWTVQNSSSQVIAQPPGRQEFVLLDIVAHPQGRTLSEVAQRNMSASGLRALAGEPVRLGEADAFVGTFEGRLQSGGRVVARAAYISTGGTVYRLAGLATADGFASVAGEFEATIRSFRTLTAAEAERIRPNRVRLHVARRGDTWDSLAQGASQGNVAGPALAVLNGASPDTAPADGQLVKVVVAGGTP